MNLRNEINGRIPFYTRLDWLCVATLCLVVLALIGVRLTDLPPLIGASSGATPAPVATETP